MQEIALRQQREGLYEPSTEHDACGMGFVAHIRGEASRSIVEDALRILARLAHRAACGCDPETGDGAGILTHIPHRFFAAELERLGLGAVRKRGYAVAQVFLPPDPVHRARCEEIFEETVTSEGQRIIGWRDVPVDASQVGRIAGAVRPVIRQLFIERRRLVPSAFERKLFIIRKLVEKRIVEDGCDPEEFFHVASMSAETIVYKGLLLPERLPNYFYDLQSEDFISGIALVHSRFSTNTFPTWDLAQPLRYVCHNGEINTVRGNRNWMLARRSLLQSAKFEGPIDRLFPIINANASDSYQFDNMLELLHLGGRTLPHAMMMLIPEAYQNDPLMSDERKAFYDYAGSLMEPWDGPAAMAFTDGHVVGATLDRNGLRPARYIVTADDRVILASETGVIDVPPALIIRKGRLQPGRIFVVDTDEGRIIDDEEVKRDIINRFPYRKWLDRNVVHLSACEPAPAPLPVRDDELIRQQRAFGYSDEDIRVVLAPMAEAGEEPTASMGTDTPLAVLSDKAPSLFSYFKQLFAQVTNPPIDPIRESLVMSLQTAIGMGGNTFDETPEQCHRLHIPGPILTNGELATIRKVEDGVFETRTLSLLYDAAAGPDALADAVLALCAAASEAIDAGYNLLILSDRGVDARKVAIPALLAVSAVHQHLVREGIRMQSGLLVETAEAREVHHFALLLGYGAAAVNPWLALDSIVELSARGEVALPPEKAMRNFIKAVDKGLLKVMSKLGISTMSSYRGAQLFEAIGLDRALVDQHFSHTASRIEGAGLVELNTENLQRHARGFGAEAAFILTDLPTGGQYQWRRQGELHKWNPATIAKLQDAVRADSYARYQEFAELANNETAEHFSIRGLFDFEALPSGAVPLDEVESAESIARRFVTGAMSFGSISAEAHETLAIAMNRLGGRSNTGEGGEESERYTPLPNGDTRRSAIKQVASARFGVHAEYLVNADELQIKMAQGAKPGEGGQLPGHKVSERIARVRCSTPGVTLISPPPHHDIYSIEDLAQLIYDLKTVNERARISVKLVSEVGIGTVAAGVSKARAECIIIAGDSGGTGASPVSSIKHAGVPWELGLAEAQQVLVRNDLRGRVRLQVDGGVRTGRDVVVGCLLGAEEFGFATAPLVAMGCIMLRKCHQNTCSVGIATQDPELTAKFEGKPEHVIRYLLYVAQEAREWMAMLGFRTMDEMVGQADRLKQRAVVGHWKASRLDLSALLHRPLVGPDVAIRHNIGQEHGLEDHLDRKLIAAAASALQGGRPVSLRQTISNADRAVGAMLAGEVARKYGNHGLADDAIHVRFTGSAGQSFGAFLPRGVTFQLEGDANDYVGKGLSGGRIAIQPPAQSSFVPEENILIGNTILYGATGGEAYFRGVAGERFAVRNSGARAVVEGVGDHGCEYMTGGIVVVLGRTGRNFAAGMSGGMAFVFDRDGEFARRCNREMVELESLIDESDIWLVHDLIDNHVKFTGSQLGRRLLDNWDMMVARFVKVMPVEYKRVLQQRRAQRRAQSQSARAIPAE
jgi:glutamate synthase (NADPH/NADH) large chain